jgi:nitrogen fixation protein
MKTTVLSVALCACVTFLAVVSLGRPSAAVAQRGADTAAGGELLTIAAMVSDKVQQLTVIDPRMRVMSVYHLELASGAITLKSVRNITWDLQLREFNGVAPLPQEIRTLLEPR